MGAGKAEAGAGETEADVKTKAADSAKPGDGDEEEEEDYGDGTILEFTPHYSYICGLRRVFSKEPNPAAPAPWLVSCVRLKV